MKDDEKMRHLMVEVGHRYWVNDENQQSIAEALGITQSEVSKLAKRARSEGIVRIHVDLPTTQSETRLKACFPCLTTVKVVPAVTVPEIEKHQHLLNLDQIGRTAAEFLLERLVFGTQIGISCGSTVQRVIQGLSYFRMSGRQMPSGCHVYPLVLLPVMTDIVALSPVSMVSQLVACLTDSRGHAVYLEAGLGVKAEDALLQSLRTLNTYVLGIGRIDFEGRPERQGSIDSLPTHEFNAVIWNLDGRKIPRVLQNLKAAGEVNYQPIDAAGNLLIDSDGEALEELRKLIRYLPLNVLQEHVKNNTASVVGVAGGKLKRDAIRAALRAKLFNVLITDSATATDILKAEEEEV